MGYKSDTNPLKGTFLEERCHKDESTAEVIPGLPLNEEETEFADDIIDYEWWVEIKTLEELIDFTKEENIELIIKGQSIEIYDDYRE